MKRTLLLSLVLSLVVLAYDANILLARGRPQKPPQQPKTETVDLTGTIQSMSTGTPGFVAYAKKSNTNNKKEPSKSWQVAPGDNMTVTIDGTATLDYLRPGQYLRFSAVLDETKEKDKTVDTVKGDVKEITIISKGDHKPGIGSETEKKSKEKDKDKDADAADPVVEVGPHKVKIIGKIQKVDPTDNHKVIVSAGSHTLEITLSSDPTIKFEFSGASILKDEPKIANHISGAKVKIHGFATETTKSYYVKADKIDATLVEPLSGKKKPAASIAKTPIKKADDDAAAPTVVATDSAAATDSSTPADSTPDVKPDDSKPDDGKPDDKKPE